MICVYCGQPSGEYDEHDACVEASIAEALPPHTSRRQTRRLSDPGMSPARLNRCPHEPIAFLTSRL